MKQSPNKDKAITIRMTEEEKWKIKELAASYGMTQSEFLIYAALSMDKEAKHSVNKNSNAAIVQQLKEVERSLSLQLKNINDTIVYMAEHKEKL